MKTDEQTLARWDQEIGMRVRLRRKEMGLTQAQLGEAIGVTFQQVQKYERGTNRLSGSALIAVARALAVKPSQLIDGVADDAAAAPQRDLARGLLLSPHGLEIAKTLPKLSPRRAAIVTELAAQLAEAA